MRENVLGVRQEGEDIEVICFGLIELPRALYFIVQIFYAAKRDCAAVGVGKTECQSVAGNAGR